ncbi:pyridoxal 5'-phosphate synthase glutaminase subunit PdxT [Leptotrichia sp. OH3620_COT-345]|uniref:pyridoxal 5'-phosphate synthase glutaminase subunit PdxT n=1 Tax=Leptotrichia sp. OH3620_COT-345 TaxID=2491048 RepID=UPI000F64E9FF|nr:pyridoxal 5'-phosphate synthase glutaminase subunit PdxT [Leptotrichia sp. OH3620_COT-345]RRD40028.1 pyridoxal 5'-phosphate synthase glutaminase subunit PdxT [Leptotrichia sp. OH3620_COT-345]
MKIGILALQGAFIEHEKILRSLNVETVQIRKRKDLEDNKIDGLILPGGESTVMGKLLHDLNLFESLKKMIAEGLPVFGTCAGMILLAREIENDTARYFGLMNIKVKRNAYGRQLGSFFTENEFKHVGIVPMTFIRAPFISDVGENVEILSKVDGNIVAARQSSILVTSYHPELNSNTKIHEYFLEICKSYVLK